MVSFTVPGEPVPWSRALSNGSQRFTPAKLRQYETAVKLFAAQAMAGRPPFGRAVPISMLVEVVLPIPASWSNRKREAAAMGTVRPTGRPDLDNFVKAALDGMNGVVIEDDSSVVRIETTKCYGQVPRMAVQVVPLPCEGAHAGSAS